MRNPQLKSVRDIKLAELKTTREALIREPLNGFDVDSTVDRENIQGAIDYFSILAQGGTAIAWTMADSTEQDVTLEDLQHVLDSYVLRKAQVFAEYQTKKALINKCTTLEELDAIEI